MTRRMLAYVLKLPLNAHGVGLIPQGMDEQVTDIELQELYDFFWPYNS